MEKNYENLQDKVVDATEKDIQDILVLQQEKRDKVLNKTEDSSLEKEGFLIYGIDSNELKELIRNKENYIIKVSKKADAISGYLVSYDFKKWMESHEDWLTSFKGTEENKSILSTKKVFYGRHIAVNDSVISSGIGKNLLDSTLKEVKGRGYNYFIVEVLLDPLTNIKSMRFVQNNGFELIGKNKDKNNNSWFVFLKNLDNK